MKLSGFDEIKAEEKEMVSYIECEYIVYGGGSIILLSLIDRDNIFEDNTINLPDGTQLDNLACQYFFKRIEGNHENVIIEATSVLRQLSVIYRRAREYKDKYKKYESDTFLKI